MAESTPKGDAQTYHRDRLLAESWDRFGVESHVVAGALASSTKQNFTEDEVKTAIDKYNKHEVEVDNPLGQHLTEEA